MLTTKRLSVIVICYNDGGSVREMYKRVISVMENITADFEIVYVNENSPDGAEDILREIASNDPRVMVVNHTRNFGGQEAYASGLYHCTGDAALLIDGDIQDPPEMFREFVQKWLQGYPTVYGIRERRKGSLLRRVCYKLFYRVFAALSDIDIPLDASDFGLMDRRVIDVINALPESNRFIRGLRAWTGFRSIGVPYTRGKRFSGQTNYTFFGYIQYAKRLIFAFSFKPLEWISHIAAIVTFLSGTAIVGYLIVSFTSDVPKGWPTLMLTILFLGSVQLLCISIIGEYIGRIYQEVKHRPHFVVQDIINPHGNNKKARGTKQSKIDEPPPS